MTVLVGCLLGKNEPNQECEFKASGFQDFDTICNEIFYWFF